MDAASADDRREEGAAARRTALALFLLLLGVYLLTSPGTVNAVDTWASLGEAAALVEQGTVRYDRLDPSVVGEEELRRAIHQGTPHTAARTPGLVANRYGFGLHVFHVPAYVVSRVVASAAGRPSLEVAKAIVGYVSAVASAAAMAVFALWAARVLRRAVPVGTTLLLGLGTFVWPLSAISYGDPIQLLSVALVLLQAARAADLGRRRDVHILGALCAWAFLCKSANAPVLLACAATAAERLPGRRLLGPAAAWGAVAVAAQLGVNAWRYDGEALYMGYPVGEQFSTPLVEGLPFLLGGWERGWIWFVPVLPAAVAGLVLAAARRPSLGVPLVAGLVAHLLLQAKFSWVHAGYCLGPRYLLLLTPILGLGCVLAADRVRDGARRTVLAAATAVSAAWMLPMATVAYFLLVPVEEAVVRAGGASLSEPVPLRTARLLAETTPTGPDEIPLAALSARPVEGAIRFDSRDAAGWQWAWLKPHASVPGAVRWGTLAAGAGLVIAGTLGLRRRRSAE